MTPPAEMTAVGTYPSADEAERARGYLTEIGIEPVEITQLSSAAWQVEAPADRREQALAELKRREQHFIADSF